MDVEKMIEKKAQQTKQTVENIHLLSHQQSSVGYILYIYLCMYIWTEKKVTTKEPHNTHNIITLLKCTLWENGSVEKVVNVLTARVSLGWNIQYECDCVYTYNELSLVLLSMVLLQNV